MGLPNHEGRPLAGPPSNVVNRDSQSIPPAIITVADLDAWCESSRGRLMVEVGIGDGTRTRTYFYANVRAAERCVDRARARGQRARVALVQTLPVGVVTGLGGVA